MKGRAGAAPAWDEPSPPPAARRLREAVPSALFRALRELVRPFGVGRSRRAGRAPEAEAAIPSLYAVALRLTGEEGEAEALVECALEAHAAWRRARGTGARAAFRLFDALYATHRAAHGSPVREEADDGAPASVERSLPVAPIALYDVGRLRAAFDALPDRLWHVLRLRDHQGFCDEDIGLLLDVSSARVARLVSEARRRLMRNRVLTGERAAWEPT